MTHRLYHKEGERLNYENDRSTRTERLGLIQLVYAANYTKHKLS